MLKKLIFILFNLSILAASSGTAAMKCSSVFDNEKVYKLLIVNEVPKGAEKIGHSSSSVYLGKDGLVYKEYSSGSFLALEEVLMTRFYVERKLPVAKVLGHSKNLIHFNDKKIIVVKEYISSKSKLDDFAETPDELETKMEKYEEIFDKDYKDWLQRQPEYIELKKDDPFFNTRMWADVDRNSNWIKSKGKWILVDP